MTEPTTTRITVFQRYCLKYLQPERARWYAREFLGLSVLGAQSACRGDKNIVGWISQVENGPEAGA